MNLKRRQFFYQASTLGLGLLQGHENATAKESPLQFAICQTDTGPTWTTLNLLVPDEGAYEFILRDSFNQGHSCFESEVLFSAHAHQLIRLTISDLPENQLFYLHVLNSHTSYIEVRSFETLNTNLTSARIALVSCMNDHLHKKYMWDRLQQTNPDVIFFLGDAVYADLLNLFEKEEADLNQLRQRFIETWSRLSFYKWAHLKPVCAIWDDHDYGFNNAGTEYKFKHESKQNFLAFYGSNLETGLISRGPGISHLWRAFGQKFIFLDNRTFRGEMTPSGLSPFGQDQENWFWQILEQANSPCWLISGSQWFGGYLQKDSYEFKFAESFKVFTEQLKRTQARVRFISGDVHFSEIMKIDENTFGYETLEITSSSMHSATVPGWHYLFTNPRRIASAGKYNFVLLDFDQSEEYQNINLASYGGREASYFSVREKLRLD